MRVLVFLSSLLILVLPFQNCSNVNFSSSSEDTILGCNPNDLACVPPPLVDRPGVVTVLLALGDSDNLPNPTVDQVSAQVVAEAMVQFSSSVANPRVLVVHDNNNGGESPLDFPNLYNNLLRRYHPAHMDEPVGGLTYADIAAYDVVWLVNPGHPMGNKGSHDTLLAFPGGVILSGDDMTLGMGFANSDLTGLTYVDNGTQVNCNNGTYTVDNNLYSNTYEVTLDPVIFKDLGANHLKFNYGNDIDLAVANSSVEILATAKLNPADCVDRRPVIARYPK